MRKICLGYVKGFKLVKQSQAEGYFPIGDLKSFLLDHQMEHTELIFYDVMNAILNMKSMSSVHLIRQILPNAPLTWGGGISGFRQMKELLEQYVDRVMVNTCLFDDKTSIKKIIEMYGSQSVLVFIDVSTSGTDFKLMRNGARIFANSTINDHLLALKDLGVSELVVRDASNQGLNKPFDKRLLELLKSTWRGNSLITTGGSTIAQITSPHHVHVRSLK